jgi:hypothetical protein
MMFQKELCNGIPNVAVRRVLRFSNTRHTVTFEMPLQIAF